MSDNLGDLEEQRRRNAVEMDERCARTREWMATNYPMKPDNACLNMTDDELRAYIRERRDLCEPIWESNRLRLAALEKR